MSKRQFIILLAVWSMVFLHLGFPFFWDKIIALVTGLIIVMLTYSMRTGDAPSRKQNHATMSDDVKASRQAPYVEHRGVPITSDPSTTG